MPADLEPRSDTAPSPDRHAPGATGLVLVDVINPLDFEGADALAPRAFSAARPSAGCATPPMRPASRWSM
jgi:hypothetical protein